MLPPFLLFERARIKIVTTALLWPSNLGSANLNSKSYERNVNSTSRWQALNSRDPRSADLTGIHNVREFYSHHYLEAVLGSDLRDILKAWKARADQEGGKLGKAFQLPGLRRLQYFTL